MADIFSIFLLMVILVFSIFWIFFNFSLFYSDLVGAPFIPLRKKYIREILAIGHLKKEDIFYDLGSGDGRVLISAVKDFGVKEARGLEISPFPYWFSKILIKSKGLRSKIKVFHKNLAQLEKSDLDEASVVFLYLFPKITEKLFQSAFLFLKPGTKIICVSFHPKVIDDHFKFSLSKKVGWHLIYFYQRI